MRGHGANPMILIKRAYETQAKSDGVRYLVDRLWPRGISKEALAIKDWLKDASPRNDLRKRFHNNPTSSGRVPPAILRRT